MGTASTKKFIKNNAGQLTEEAALLTSAGPIDAGSLPALNADGVLDSSILNAKASSAGSADAGKTVLLDPSGRIDSTMMPTGICAETASIVASEALSAGDFVNVWSNAGTANVRKADATTTGKETQGFVLAAVAQAASATVYFSGTNTQCAGLTPGVQFLATTAGQCTATAPTGSGNVVQRVGFAVSATEVSFHPQLPVALA